MAKIHFRPYTPNQTVLFPQRIDEDIAENDPIRMVDALVESLNLEGFRKLYKECGRSPYHPKMMLKVILYAYMNNIYSCRKIEKLLRRDIHYIWLAGYEKPDFITINRFRNRVKKEINEVFTQTVLLLSSKGFISLNVEYIDGTKIESKANKYTFVWRKSVERNRERLMKKISVLLSQIDDVIAQEKASENNEEIEFTPSMLTEMAGELRTALEQTSEPSTKEQKSALGKKRKQLKELEAHRDKLQEYNNHLDNLQDRNSYSKTDKEATFMRMKEDAMHNGQTKPGYNLQIATENQFIIDYSLFPNPTDTLTMIPFLKSFADRYGRLAHTVVADSGYGSEENYHFMSENGMEAYVKYNCFHMEQRPRFKPNPFKAENFFYNEEQDYCVCPMGQKMQRAGTRHTKTESGYVVEYARYRAVRCEGCPLRCLCFKAKGNRTIELNHRLRIYKQKARELLCSEEGLKHRGQRCIEPEAVFGQIKFNMNYKRFRHFGKDKVLMDFSFLAIAFNIKKMCTKMNKEGINWPIKHLYGLITTHLSYWEQNIEIIFRISLLEKVNNALIVDKEKRVNRVLRHTLFILSMRRRGLSERVANRFGHFCKLFSRKLQLGIGEKHIFLALHRNQMNMSMRHFQTQDSHSNLLTRKSLSDSQCYLLGKNVHSGQFFIFQIKDIVYLTFRNDQRMSFYQRIDVQKCEELLVLRNFITGNFACYNSTEYGCHNDNILKKQGKPQHMACLTV